MSKYQEILKKYWGYPSFRSLQEDIIKSADSGKDTLALLPTGGGKSITFQIVALSKKGLCIVITPLIALMNDQVDNLKRRNIKAVAIHSGLSKEEENIAYDNCTFGEIKFLYLSPERLQTELFINKIKNMNINLIAVDEAHCISQWGYDFRPSYLKIATIREYLPDIPILALTATATPEVVNDIQEKLKFEKKNVLQKSFERKNLSYIVRKTEEKTSYLLKILRKSQGSGIVYVRNRKKTQEIAYFLQQHKISADYYHAGIDNISRAKKQESWKNNNCRIMVCTNAFGMGIDKADVRIVVHLDIPDSLEAYFQEAGRAGRDEKKAYAVLLYSKKDIAKLKGSVSAAFPERSKIKNIYKALGNYFQVPIGSGKGLNKKFNIFHFAKQYKFQLLQVYNAVKFLQKEGYIELTDEIHTYPKIKFAISRDDLYKFQVLNAAYDKFIKLLLRSYTGIFSDYVAINEEYLAKKTASDKEIIKQYLIRLSKAKILRYIPAQNSPFLIFVEERLEQKSLRISPENYEQRKKVYVTQIEAVLKYVQTNDICRSVLLLEYFGEKKGKRCKECDVCRSKTESGLSKFRFEEIKTELFKKLSDKKISAQKVTDQLSEELNIDADLILKTIRYLIDSNEIKNNENHILELSNMQNRK